MIEHEIPFAYSDDEIIADLMAIRRESRQTEDLKAFVTYYEILKREGGEWGPKSLLSHIVEDNNSTVFLLAELFSAKEFDRQYSLNPNSFDWSSLQLNQDQLDSFWSMVDFNRPQARLLLEVATIKSILEYEYFVQFGEEQYQEDYRKELSFLTNLKEKLNQRVTSSDLPRS